MSEISNSPFLYRIIKVVTPPSVPVLPAREYFAVQRGIPPERPEHFGVFGAWWVNALPALCPNLQHAKDMLGFVKAIDAGPVTEGEVVYPEPKKDVGPVVTA